MGFFSRIPPIFKISRLVDFFVYIKPPHITKAEYIEKIMTLTYSDGTTAQYHGDCTCWSKYPNMEGVSIFFEEELHRYWKYNKVHGKPFTNPNP